jgi:hypothetical protein
VRDRESFPITSHFVSARSACVKRFRTKEANLGKPPRHGDFFVDGGAWASPAKNLQASQEAKLAGDDHVRLIIGVSTHGRVQTMPRATSCRCGSSIPKILRSLGLVHQACRQGLNEEVYRLQRPACFRVVRGIPHRVNLSLCYPDTGLDIRHTEIRRRSSGGEVRQALPLP